MTEEQSMRRILDVFIANGLKDGQSRKDATRGCWAKLSDTTADSIGFVRGRKSWGSTYHDSAYEVVSWSRNPTGRVEFDVVEITDQTVLRCLYDMPVASPAGARAWRISGDVDDWLKTE